MKLYHYTSRARLKRIMQPGSGGLVPNADWWKGKPESLLATVPANASLGALWLTDLQDPSPLWLPESIQAQMPHTCEQQLLAREMCPDADWDPYEVRITVDVAGRRLVKWSEGEWCYFERISPLSFQRVELRQGNDSPPQYVVIDPRKVPDPEPQHVPESVRIVAVGDRSGQFSRMAMALVGTGLR